MPIDARTGWSWFRLSVTICTADLAQRTATWQSLSDLFITCYFDFLIKWVSDRPDHNAEMVLVRKSISDTRFSIRPLSIILSISFFVGPHSTQPCVGPHSIQPCVGHTALGEATQHTALCGAIQHTALRGATQHTALRGFTQHTAPRGATQALLRHDVSMPGDCL